MIVGINPATEEEISRFEPLSDADLDGKIERAAVAARSWGETTILDRVRVVARAGELLDTEKEQFGRLMSLEMGKPIRSAIEEAAKCAVGCRYYAEHATALLADEPVEIEGINAHIAYHPIGVVLAVMPWNFPFWQVVRFAAPALCAGNVGLLKHASNVPQCALALEDLFRRAGAPDGVFQTLLIGSDRVAGVIADPRVAAVTLTGSEGAGRSVAATAGHHIKKTVLELGGSDPFIALESADVDAAAATAVRARVINNGQSCIAAKRFIVVDAVFARFAERFVAGMRALRVGDPMDPQTDVGPLATKQIRDDLDAQVRSTLSAGATALLEGGPRSGKGWFYDPVVLTNIPTDSVAYREELFGPVASLFRARDTVDALRIANDSRFGLGGAVWTRDRLEGERCARELAVGTVAINGMVASDPRLPFGGVKSSGYGRELGVVGIREFVNVKTVRYERKMEEGRGKREEERHAGDTE